MKKQNKLLLKKLLKQYKHNIKQAKSYKITSIDNRKSVIVIKTESEQARSSMVRKLRGSMIDAAPATTDEISVVIDIASLVRYVLTTSLKFQ